MTVNLKNNLRWHDGSYARANIVQDGVLIVCKVFIDCMNQVHVSAAFYDDATTNRYNEVCFTVSETVITPAERGDLLLRIQDRINKWLENSIR